MPIRSTCQGSTARRRLSCLALGMRGDWAVGMLYHVAQIQGEVPAFTESGTARPASITLTTVTSSAPRLSSVAAENKELQVQNRDLQHRLVNAALPIYEANGKSGQEVGK